MLQIRWFFGTIGLVGFCAALACSGTDPVQGTSSPKATGGAPPTSGTGGSGGASVKTCGAMKVPSGCATFSDSLTKANCTTCHSSAGAPLFKTIDFITNPSATLLGKSAVYADMGAIVTPATCPATREILLNPADFDKSLFVTKLRGTGFACGTAMPQSFAITPADKDCLLRWACSLIQ